MINEIEIFSEKKHFKHFFLLLGIGSLGVWNSILSQLPFFKTTFPNYNPEFIFPVFNFVLNTIFQFYLVFRGNLFTYKIQLLLSLSISIFVLLTLPLTSFFFTEFTGFLLTSILILFQGFANSILLCSLFGLISFLPQKYRVSFSTGMGLAGVTMNLIGFLIFFIFKGNQDSLILFYGSILYFSVVSIIIILNIIAVNEIYKDRFFIYCMRKSGDFTDKELQDNMIFMENENNPEEELIEENRHKKTWSKYFFVILRIIPDVCICIFANYVAGSIVFPGICLRGTLVANPQLNILLMLSIFNVFDTIGRKFADYFLISRKSTNLFALSRYFIGIIIVLVAVSNENYLSLFQNKILIFISNAFFAFSNGYVTSLFFIHGPDQVNSKLKGEAGSVLSFFLIMGIFVGSILANFFIQLII